MSTSKAAKKVTKLSDSLDALEAQLEPLLSLSLVETAAGLETLQEAKLHTLLPYLINDLIFIYLRTRGVDPKTHAVVQELERVRQYFEKIKDSETQQQRRTGVDKAAATRFIKHAIAQAQQPIHENQEDTRPSDVASPSQPTKDAPLRVTDKMREREQYLKELREQDENEEEEPVLEVFNADGPQVQQDDDEPKGPAKSTMTGGKKRRKAMDPFASLESPSSAPSSSIGSPALAEEGAKRSKKKRKGRPAHEKQ